MRSFEEYRWWIRLVGLRRVVGVFWVFGKIDICFFVRFSCWFMRMRMIRSVWRLWSWVVMRSVRIFVFFLSGNIVLFCCDF